MMGLPWWVIVALGNLVALCLFAAYCWVEAELVGTEPISAGRRWALVITLVTVACVGGGLILVGVVGAAHWRAARERAV